MQHAVDVGGVQPKANRMKLLSVSDLMGMEAGEQILAFTGKITSVFTRKEGVGKDKDSTMEIIIVSGGKDSVKVMVFDKEPITKKAVGKHILVRATKGGNNKWNGIIHQGKSEYQGKWETVVKASGACEITFAANTITSADGEASAPPPPEDDGPPLREPDEPADQRCATPPAAPGNPPGQAHQFSVKAPRKEIKQALGRCINVEWDIIQAADILNEACRANHGEPMMEAHYVGVCGRMFIELAKSGYIGDVSHKLYPELATAAAKLGAEKGGQ